MGVVLIVGLIYYFIRRLTFPYSDLSVSEDYILLILLILTVVMGNLMRFFGDIHVADYRAFLQSLLTFSPAFPDALATSSTRWVLVFHVLSANLVFVFFPFSKLVHVIATFPANLARRR